MEEKLEFIYTFTQEDGKQKRFEVKLHPDTLEFIHEPYEELPSWTNLGFNQCPNCPLNVSEFKHCPVAANMHTIIDFFKDSISFENVKVHIQTQQRDYAKKTSLQEGVSSLIGIIMVSSGCPVLAKLKPMVRFHLPFASSDETLYRTISTYLLKQYFRANRGLTPDWKLTGLMEIYKDIHILNVSFFSRLSNIKGKDANINALIILDNFANYVNFRLDKDKLLKVSWMFDDLDE
ncbi:MAG: hypothetical protein K8R49_00155 [Candidatus Cloacimonetes bacterium]|nr:hypothetical protein [Candidatus Cloacimonadota bacterium]